MQIHLVNSDGIYTPHEIIEIAYGYGIKVISITDHNFLLDETEFENTRLIASGRDVKYIEGIGFQPDIWMLIFIY